MSSGPKDPPGVALSVDDDISILIRNARRLRSMPALGLGIDTVTRVCGGAPRSRQQRPQHQRHKLRRVNNSNSAISQIVVTIPFINAKSCVHWDNVTLNSASTDSFNSQLHHAGQHQQRGHHRHFAGLAWLGPMAG